MSSGAFKPHYFEDEHADPKDLLLQMAIRQGYVPPRCLLNGQVVMAEVNAAMAAPAAAGPAPATAAGRSGPLRCKPAPFPLHCRPAQSANGSAGGGR